MYFEIYKQKSLVKRGRDILGGISFTNALMDAPSCRIQLPIWYHEYLSGHEEIKIFVNGKCFFGIVVNIAEDKDSEIITVNLEHVVSEWEYRQISVNNAIKDKNINIIYKGSELATENGVTISANPFYMLVDEAGTFTDAKYIERSGASAWEADGDSVNIAVDYRQVKAEAGEYDVTFKAGEASVTVKASVVAEDVDHDDPDVDPSVIDDLADIYADKNFAYPGWVMNLSDKAKNTTIDYVYSRQNKLDALTKTMELTPDLFWRVRMLPEKVIDVSEFGEHKQWIISTKPSGMNNIRMVSEPTIKHDFSKVINLATVYSEKSDSGMSSMTLREVYVDSSLQEDGFPVIILRSDVNNERDYKQYSQELKKIAPNNELEYAVIDEESVALEDGVLIEGTYAFNDLSPFTPDTEDGETQEVTDEDRVKAATTAYHAVIRKLKEARRSFEITLETEELPAEIAPGDMVRFIYDNSIFMQESCTPYMKKILSYDEWFYVTRIDYDISEGGFETDTITLEKYLKLERETANET